MRLANEELITAAELADEVFAYPETVARWITDGKCGVYLDGVHRPGVGWMTSRAAYERFQDKLRLHREAGKQTKDGAT